MGVISLILQGYTVVERVAAKQHITTASATVWRFTLAARAILFCRIVPSTLRCRLQYQ